MKTSKKCSNKALEQEQLASCQSPTHCKATIFPYEAIIINVVKHRKCSVDAGQRFSYGNLEKNRCLSRERRNGEAAYSLKMMRTQWLNEEPLMIKT